jgi:DNA-directed RNA polymerase specialized sigma24 family protein
MYTVHDVAAIFRVSTRSIQKWMSRGRLSSRSMPGRAKFLSQDLEGFIHQSCKERRK